MLAINRYSGPHVNYGPLAYLKDTYVSNGHNGWNLMVVPKKTDDGKTSFLVMVQQLYETQVFEQVGAPVPNRGGEVGVEKIVAVKYNQTAAENASKNILHEEVGMWMYQTPSGTDNPSWSSTSESFPHPILRQGVIPHGNSILLAGDFQQATAPGYPSATTAFLPKIIPVGKTKPNPDVMNALLVEYKKQIDFALSLLPATETQFVTTQSFINPTTLLDAALVQESPDGKSQLEFDEIINLHVNVDNAKGYGGISSIPFAHSFADPIDFDAYLSIQVVKNTLYNPASATTLDEVPDYFQLQYFQNIPIRFAIEFMGEQLVVEFPHYQLNTLVKV